MKKKSNRVKDRCSHWKYDNNGPYVCNWLRSIVSDETMYQLGDSIWKNDKFVGDFYYTPNGGTCNFHWTRKHFGKNPYVVMAFEV